MTSTETLARPTPPTEAEERHPFLVALGERVRNLRSRKGMTRKAVAIAADVSERHLANLEYGTGNASILVLAAGGAGAALLAGRTDRRCEHLLTGMAADPRAAAGAQRGRPAPRPAAAGGVAGGQRRRRHAGPAGACGADRPARRGQVHAGPAPGRRPGLPLHRTLAARSSSSPAAASARSTTSTAPTPTAATSGGRWKRRSRSTPRW
jgi:DNA-binding XRE family transcriptional regulator